MNYGLATVVNANGSMADLPDEAVWKLPEKFTDAQLAEALSNLWENRSICVELGVIARKVIREDHNPKHCADLYRLAIERNYRTAVTGITALSRAIANIEPAPNNNDLIGLAEAISKSMAVKPRARQLLVDVSVLIQRYGKTSIQKRLLSILRDLMANPPEGFRVEPVISRAKKMATIMLGNILWAPLVVR